MWRRFRQASGQLQTATVYDKAWEEIRTVLLGKRPRDDRAVEVAIKDMREQAELLRSSRAPLEEQAAANLALLILQAPRAARAQQAMDKHSGGYQNHQARLYELIDFNDAFDTTVLALPEEYLGDFPIQLWDQLVKFCRLAGARMLTAKQYNAIVHGLSREIAVYRGALKEGYKVYMTSRSADAMGIDMVLIDPSSGTSLNIDCKTHSAYHFRLLDLVREGRLSEKQREVAEELGFCKVINGHGVRAVQTTLLRISTEQLGEIHNFSFQDTRPLKALIERAMYA